MQATVRLGINTLIANVLVSIETVITACKLFYVIFVVRSPPSIYTADVTAYIIGTADVTLAIYRATKLPYATARRN